MNKVLLIMAAGLLLAGCVGQSDNLGFQKKGGVLTTYSESYQPARDMLRQGQFEELASTMHINATDEEGVALSDEENKDKLIRENSELSILERGLLALNCGDYERALQFFDAAEIKMEQVESQSKMQAGASKVGKGFVAGLVGAEEATDYALRGYEKVMLYNYKALCYMLLGDRRAYNVTRRAIDKQQEEWEAFRTMIEAAEARQQETMSQAGKPTSEGMLSTGDTRDEYTRQKAASVPSAYVNPFGDYMDAMIMEIDSIKSADLRDNARIAYSKVLDNNGACAMARQAVNDLKKRSAPRGQKLVQILLADGFSPERKVQTAAYQIDQLKAMVNYTQATPVPSQVAGALVTPLNASGKATGGKVNLSSLSDMDAIILRDDQDRAPLRNLMFAAAVLRSGAINAFGGNTLMGLMGKLQKPDTRSWLSLPGKVLVARMYVPVKASEVELHTTDAQGHVLAATRVKLADAGPTVIYAVSYDSQLRAYANKTSWLNQ